MGKVFTGGTERLDDVSMLTGDQNNILSQLLQQLGPEAIQALSGQLGGMSQEDMQSTFQQSYVDPAMQAFNQQMIPSIQESFGAANAGSSSALNQALAQGASNLSTQLGSQYGQFAQGQQGLQQNALSQFMPLVTGQTFSPQFQQHEGLMGPLLGAAGQAAGNYMASSEKVKENIRDYDSSLDELNKLDVKQYDYIESVGGLKDRVGLIAENVPEELTLEKQEILHVDLYGVMGLMINAIKELSKKVDKMEAA